MHFFLRFCQKRAPGEVLEGSSLNRGLRVLFKSDRSISGTGAQCRAECISSKAKSNRE